MKLSTTLLEYCRRKGWSLNRLAKETQIAVQTLHGWTTGRKNLNIEQLRIVAKALEVSLHGLCFGEPDPHATVDGELLKEIFSGDVRVTIHKIERRR